jgi:hypothetical protein
VYWPIARPLRPRFTQGNTAQKTRRHTTRLEFETLINRAARGSTGFRPHGHCCFFTYDLLPSCLLTLQLCCDISGYIYAMDTQLSKLAKVLTLLTCILNVPRSNLGWDTHYPETPRSFPFPPRASTPNYAMIASLHVLSNSLFTYNRIISRDIVWATDNIVK